MINFSPMISMFIYMLKEKLTTPNIYRQVLKKIYNIIYHNKTQEQYNLFIIKKGKMNHYW